MDSYRSEGSFIDFSEAVERDRSAFSERSCRTDRPNQRWECEICACPTKGNANRFQLLPYKNVVIPYDSPLRRLAESLKANMTFISYLAEDNEKILENLIETLIEIADVKVTAHSATQAEASRWLSLNDGKWHLAIVDLFLEVGSGLGVLAGCRNREPYQKIVLLTNYATPDIRKRATALGADAVFDKSTELDLLLAYCISHTANVKSEETQAAEFEAVSRAAVTPSLTKD